MSCSVPTSRSGGTRWQRERVIFLYMPKAAGSTLNQVIARHYPEGSCCIDPGRQQAALEEFTSLPWSDREKIRLLRGHIGFDSTITSRHP